MKIKKEFMKKNIADECIVVPIGNTALTFNGLITLNEVGEFLWDRLSEETSIEKLVFELMNEYEVDEKTAVKDVVEFVTKFKQAEIIE